MSCRDVPGVCGCGSQAEHARDQQSDEDTSRDGEKPESSCQAAVRRAEHGGVDDAHRRARAGGPLVEVVAADRPRAGSARRSEAAPER
jgi:hypothetical protein